MDAGITIEIADPEVDIKWGQILFKLGEVACHGLGVFAGKLDSAADALNAIQAMFEGVSINDAPPTKAWRLVALSIATAVSELSATSLDNAQQKAVLKAFKTFRKNVDTTLQGGNHVLTPKFMVYPAQLELYKALRKELISALKSARLDGKTDVEHLSGKLDSAFNRSVFRILRTEPGYFQSLRASLETPGLGIAQHEFDWNAYRAHLIDQFEVAPVFGQEESKISLSQLYIPPRAQWQEKSIDKDGNNQTEVHTVELTEYITEWISARDLRHDQKLIHGGPGRGKSTFAKALAANLAKNEGLRPLFIELQKLSFDGRLVDEIGDLLTKNEESFKNTPLLENYKDPQRPFVLIFDGLDELARPGGKGADDLARDFAHALDMLLQNLNTSDTLRAVAIVTGRDTIIQALKSRTSGLADCHVLEACGYAPMIDISINHSTASLEAVDQRPAWWKRYAAATGKSANVPMAFVASELEELSNEPLLCYLLALADIANQNWQDVADNPNKIYQKLLHDVWDRKWGDGRKGPTKSITKESDFDLLMETMGLAAWHGDGGENRIATMSGFRDAFAITRAEEVWKKFNEDQANNQEKSLSSLALTFYFKRPNTDSDGFEFSHKSFSEYLVARFLFRSAMELAEDFNQPRRTPESLLQDWLKIASPTCINEYIFPFIRNEARTHDIKTLRGARTALEKLFSIVIRDGMPAHKGIACTWRLAEQMQRNGEIALLACLNAIIRELFDRDPNTELLSFDWGQDETAPARFIRRLIDSQGADDFNFIGLSHIDFNVIALPLFMNSLFLAYADLEQCRFARANLTYSNFTRATLTQTQLINANLSRASLMHTQLRHADLAHANLTHADLTHANLAHANLTDADMTHADMTHAVLRHADMTHAVLRHAVLRHADLSDIDLTGADLEGVDLMRANLMHANLTGADLTGANLTDANLTDADLTGAVIDNANLPRNWKAEVRFDKTNPPIGKPLLVD